MIQSLLRLRVLLGRASDCLLRCEASVEPSVQSPNRNPATWVLCPLRNALGFSKYLYNSVVSAVSGLHQGCSKSAVSGFIIAVIILPVQCMNFVVGLFESPRLEALVVQPLWADPYTTAPVPRKSCGPWIQTPRLHIAPDVVESAVFNPTSSAGFRAETLRWSPSFYNGSATTFAGVYHASPPFEALRDLLGKLVSELTAFRTGCTALSYPFPIVHQEVPYGA